MEKISIIKTFWQYIKQHGKTLLLITVFALIFSGVFSLYRIEPEAITYSIMLCAAIGLVWFVIDFARYYLRHLQFVSLKKRVIFDLEQLPVPKNLVEYDYRELIEAIHQDKIQYISKNDSLRTETLDYYTLWVHQIKTPIAAMRLILQSEDVPEYKDITAELFKIEQYVDMVLSYLRLDSASSDLLIRQYQLDDIVKQAVRKYAPLFIQKKIALDLKEIDCIVTTDEKWLVFVIEQILSNSLKYTNKGKITIYAGGNKTLIIQDTGIGISPEDLPRICEKGFTGYNGRDDKKATGLGLYLCKRTLKNLSHTINIQSQPGKGTTVIIGLDTVNTIIE